MQSDNNHATTVASTQDTYKLGFWGGWGEGICFCLTGWAGQGRARQNGARARQGEAKLDRGKAGQASRALEQHYMHTSSGESTIGFICYSHPFIGFL